MAPQYTKDQPESFINAIRNVAIVGATGQIGKVFTEHLLKSGKQTVTALTRSGSETQLPYGVKNAPIDYNDEGTLIAALIGQDFLVITLALSAPPDTHSKLVRAAAKAGVRYIMPNAYGTDFYSNPKLLDDIPALKYILANVQEIEELGINWIALTPNFWYEYSLGIGPFTFGFDFPNRTATFYDEGTTKIHTTTWPQCGRALAALVNLKKIPVDENDYSVTLAQFCNQPMYISSFTLSQREMFDSINKLLGWTDDDWKISYQPTAERYKEGLEELANGDGTGFLKALYARVFDPAAGGIFETHNNVLGLPKEDLDEATLAAHHWAIAQAKSG
ncbi:hypothetical protein ASPWEDRAFT_148461 [Aspergillus wentii DTO 134E9]|uniref:NAD(P)-binding domain-containing protein n=1 Tax=Aspergillus wentii DTO 134E9 TaxID=1073089 RepID=A0A1L9RTR6_ASPWE|nr:uncharacterized protein ASPWEDRAFT_148461 [Aspergillus wentii DTO 134E9]OJJ38319.1 hypothetical protein ASPWEDRAFT_148461 [Aspergillus wentii DTO 134E9]